MEQTWRWFGPDDVVRLADARQAGATGIVTALHHIPYGVVWSEEEIGKRNDEIAADPSLGLRWSVVESLPGAEADHPPEVVRRARAWFDASSEDDRRQLLANIMAGLPGAFDRYDIPGLRRMLDRYRNMTRDGLRENLARFLRAVVPTAEEVGIRMCIHPDDPPRPTFGLPRVVGSADDLAFIVGACDSDANGITFCTGSLGAGPHNDVPAMAKRFAGKIHFAHLRNVTKEPDGSFMEADHLGGDVDMVPVVTALLEEQEARRDAGDPRWRIPFRPDHGHELLDDVGKAAFPGYSAIGRLRGMAEIRGVMTAVAAMRRLPG